MTTERFGGLLGLLAATALSTGCATSTIGWVEGQPSAPGSGQHSSTTAPQSNAQSEQAPDPFDTTQRQRITLVEPWVEQAARAHNLEPALVHGVIWVESRHQPRAKSSAGARGLMQLMPATANAMARAMGKNRARVYDPEFSTMAGSLYLSRQLKHYDGDMRLALAAYNAGAGNVDRWLAEDGELPPNSVRYVELVMDAKRRFEARTTPPPQTRPEQTQLAKREPAAVVPEPPAPKVAENEYYDDEELGRVPRHVVVAPEPGANEVPPPMEPPLADTPYPPNDDDFAPASALARADAEPASADAPTSDEDEGPEPARTGLPSVLD